MLRPEYATITDGVIRHGKRRRTIPTYSEALRTRTFINDTQSEKRLANDGVIDDDKCSRLGHAAALLGISLHLPSHAPHCLSDWKRNFSKNFKPRRANTTHCHQHLAAIDT